MASGKRTAEEWLGRDDGEETVDRPTKDEKIGDDRINKL